MPYVKKEKRPLLDLIVKAMVKFGVQADGDLNYILYKFCKYHVTPSYNNYKNFAAELNEAAEWIRERLLKPYEHIKREENGEV